MAERIAFEMILLEVSQIPIGLTPGHLFSAINRQARKADRPLGSLKDVQRLLANMAIELHRSQEAEWKDVQRRLQQCIASSPEGPAAPLVLRAAERIQLESILS